MKGCVRLGGGRALHVVGGHCALWRLSSSVRRRLCVVCGGMRSLCFLGAVYSGTVGTSASQSRGKKWRIDYFANFICGLWPCTM